MPAEKTNGTLTQYVESGYFIVDGVIRYHFNSKVSVLTSLLTFYLMFLDEKCL